MQAPLSPLYNTRGAKFVKLTFWKTGGSVYVGYGQTDLQPANGAYGTLHTGTNTIATAAHQIWWDKWSSVGNVTKWTWSCVNLA